MEQAEHNHKLRSQHKTTAEQDISHVSLAGHSLLDWGQATTLISAILATASKTMLKIISPKHHLIILSYSFKR